jgi:hypothetical protein
MYQEPELMSEFLIGYNTTSVHKTGSISNENIIYLIYEYSKHIEKW